VGTTGFLLLAISVLLGEFLHHDFGVSHDVGLPHDVGTPGGVEAPDGHGGDEPSWLSVRVIAASAVGFGASGFVAASLGLPPFASWPVAAAGFVAVGAGAYFAILRPLARQQYNSLLSRYSYVGRDAVVTLDILPGGSGQVTFRDRQGARVTQNATSDVPDAVAKGARVRIVDVADGGVVVHRNRFSA